MDTNAPRTAKCRWLHGRRASGTTFAIRKKLRKQSCRSDHNEISSLVTGLISEASPDGIRVTGTARGSFNFVHFIKVVGGRLDGMDMALRIPSHGREELWTGSDRDALISQALTMIYIKDNTNVPIPRVYFYDGTFSNEINAPFILMECISGKSLGDRMVAWDIQGNLGNMLSKSLESIAKAMVELGKLQFGQIGKLQFPGNKTGTVPFVSQDDTLGPIDSSEQYFRALFETSGHVQGPDWSLEHERICEAMLEAVPNSKMSQDQQVETFGLIHRDLDAQNLLVDAKGKLVAILDW